MGSLDLLRLPIFLVFNLIILIIIVIGSEHIRSIVETHAEY